MLLRFYQGFADGHIYVTCYAIVSTEFTQNRGEAIGYLEAGMGLGLMMGAPLGQAFSVLMSYPFIFFGSGILLILPLTLTAFLIPRRVEKYQEDKVINRMDTQIAYEVSYGEILKNTKVLNSLLFSIIGGVVMIFNQMLITNQLVKIGVSPQLTGNYFIKKIQGIQWGFLDCHFSFSASFVELWLIRQKIIIQFKHLSQQVLYHYIFKDLLTFCGQLSNQFIQITPIYRYSLARMFIGMVLMDLSISLLSTSLLPNIIKAVEEKEKISENNDQLIDKASTLYTLQFTIISLLAPMLGGQLSDNFGYNKSCDLMGMTSAFLGILYFVVNILIKNLRT
ncbi:permeases of the major facilitator superfamily [Stylonychia lemnae]|uniref:Permeases of the major facilitator superfamily n=1 Tax=Stylonychia lemnae TaxID=5949 RepID=A0A077ZWG7_STYLE|nr:permeases of the major facilitator superfamily [Stylonychia lemnae]|eukprot:CDW74290.1 permeases of the major facilitator superfamily [Stylonychia lemnae]